jgi:enamine deaminase RidA (YjgF/YER057c/UK114 family)
VAGQVGWDAQQKLVSGGFAAQFAQALDNVIAVVRTAGSEPIDIVKMTVFVTDLDAYREAARALTPIWRERFDSHYPAMTLVQVAGLLEAGALVEIDAVASLAEDQE